jgi:hypothetical protein
MLCPTDDGRGRPYDGGANSGGLWARGNYGYNSGLALILDNETVWDHTKSDADGIEMTCGRGVGGAGVSSTIAQITDGTSHTIALAELRSGRVPKDRRGVWAMQMIGSNLLGQHGSNYAGGPNDCQAGTDDIRDHAEIATQAGGNATLASDCMGVCDAECGSWNISAQAAVRSRHVGGVFAAMCDGSVQFISDFVDIGQETTGLSCKPQNFGVWQRLNCPDDGFPVSGGGL